SMKSMKSMKSMRRTNAAIVVAVLVASVSTALAAAAAPAVGQMDERTKRSLGLTTDTIQAVLKDLQVYDMSDIGPAMRLRAYVFAHKDDPRTRNETEAALLAFVQGAPAPAGLMEACRALSLIGGPDSVPVLAALAVEPGTTDAARYALERIPAGEADAALLAALDKAQGDVRRGIIFSIGERRAAAAVPALARLAAGKDVVLASDAIKALGKIGGAEAIEALTSALKRTALRSEAGSALLLAAEGALAGGDKAAAMSVYNRVFAAKVPAALRQAAFKGRIAAGPDAQATILEALAGKDTTLHAPALILVRESFGPDEIGPVAELMARLPEPAQVQLAALLADYPVGTAQPYLLAAAESPSVGVRLAALRAIAKAGDGKAVGFLAAKAARTAGAERDAAREALARMKGADVDAAVLEHLGQASDEAVEAELIRAASERRIAEAKPALMELVESGPPGLKPRAAAALRTLGAQADIPALLDLLGGLEAEPDREAMQEAIAAVARTNPRELARAGEVKARLAAEQDARKRADLLRVLGKIGDDSALANVRAALADPVPVVADAAVRALAEWPTITARDDVLGIARESIELNHRVLAIRACVRMIGLEPHRAPEGATADLLNVLALSPRAEEKRLVLGMLGRFPCVTSLKTAESLLADTEVAAEAKLAADRIRNALK
ncbi:MAG: HEAT repeat domain-containing protein, partial [Candidatus Aminicenantes bacterium]|nr:HEAT repeat domain-containing protein [Candidatus Aminicenantes bacterium]